MDSYTFAKENGLIGGVSLGEARDMGLLKDDFKNEPLDTDKEDENGKERA